MTNEQVGGEKKEKSLDERKRILARQVQMAVARGGRIESQTDETAVICYGQPINHTLHLILSLCTCGIWYLVWLVMGLTKGVKREMITVDDFGEALVQKLGK
jgi:hypothetical protein